MRTLVVAVVLAGMSCGPYTPPGPVSVDLKAKINNDPASEAYLTQNLSEVYTNADPRTYPLSSYSYMILPTKVQGGFSEDKGKTLAAFLACIDRLVREGAEGSLKDETSVLYVSPLKALGNDIRKNLEEPLAEIRDAAQKNMLFLPLIRDLLRAQIQLGARTGV